MKFNMDLDWNFHKGDIYENPYKTHTESYLAAKAGGAPGPANPNYDKTTWEFVTLPHDYAVTNEINEKYGRALGYKDRQNGWYAKRFKIDEKYRDKQILFEFEGISGQSIIYFNGSVIGRNFSGYNSFVCDGTDMALFGDDINDLTVYVNASVNESWWYEGAGIYRHVNMYVKNKIHFAHNGIFIAPKKENDKWKVDASVTIENGSFEDKEVTLTVEIPELNVCVSEPCLVKEFDSLEKNITFNVDNPKLWDIDSPNLYKVNAYIKENGEIIENESINTGFRTIAIDKDGFYLNGRKVFLYGTCNHQDHAGVGVAINDGIDEYRIKLLKDLGTNAYRCAHGNPSKAVLDACDKYGILVMDENRQFNTATTDGLKQITDMVTRDRNHPSVVMYSLYNEEPLQDNENGRKLASRLNRVVKKLDDTRFTLGANNSGILNKDGAGDVCDIIGVNYQSKEFDRFLEAFPNTPIVGSENCSALMTRGCYKSDNDKNELGMLDTETVGWGDTYIDGFNAIKTRPRFMGYFVWTGFDYRGEPTPFGYPSISTFFGIMDTCGFKKSAYYLNKSLWYEEKIVHIVSHWNFNENEKPEICIFSNCKELEIFVNDKLVAETQVGADNRVFVKVDYEPGKITVKDKNSAAQDTVYTYSKLSKLKLEAGMDKVVENDAVCVNVYANDENDHFVFNANDKVYFTAQGGQILGVGNGNPNCHEDDVASERSMFNGCVQAVVKANIGAQKVIVTAKTDSGLSSTIEIEVEKLAQDVKLMPSVKERYLTSWRRTLELSDTYPEYEKEISEDDMNTWVVAKVGNGSDPVFYNKVGYAVYKTKAQIKKGEELIFNRVAGEQVDLYIDLKPVYVKENCLGGKRLSFVSNETKEIDITLVVKDCESDDRGGIVKPVAISEC